MSMTSWKKLWAVVQLYRPPLLVLGFLASYSLLLWTGQETPGLKPVLVIFAIAFGNLAFNTFNEYFDRWTDAVNKPWKPLPSGMVSPQLALWSAVAFLNVSAICTVLLSALYDVFYLIGFVGYACAAVYNVLRKKDLVGNAFMAATYGIAALMATYPEWPHMLFAAPFTLYTMTVNILAQWQDIEADRASGLVTAPIQLGRRLLPFCLSLSAVGITCFTWLYLYFRRLFLLLCVAAYSVVVPSGYCVAKGDRQLFEWVWRRIGRLLLIVAFLWLVLESYLPKFVV